MALPALPALPAFPTLPALPAPTSTLTLLAALVVLTAFLERQVLILGDKLVKIGPTLSALTFELVAVVFGLPDANILGIQGHPTATLDAIKLRLEHCGVC